MRIEELSMQLEKEGLLQMDYLGCRKYYVDGEFVYNDGQWRNIPDLFGIYKSKESGNYVFFITDTERGNRCHSESFATEEEACECLLEMTRSGKSDNTELFDKTSKTTSNVNEDRYTYYKFDIGDGGMRKKGNIVEYIDKNGEWVEDIELLRMFIGLDGGFKEITEKEAEILVENRKRNKMV
ncbi:hypothetical protein D6856_02740 [Butyrivibrio sp. XB500-5]|uniref:hypothetical protein n=1 Tax=Butyrivibrio sp. XB500-5 TaxID=2364880 RepID=UPI000EA9879C|nr:hypothetical protein [Butyrivibrio sp. XB500-5]RKM63053.1 hypothetical protein D6856_02740 [Butyrivibrio sp. XB500-5]